MRGLAALAVLLGHAYSLVPGAPQHLGAQHHLADLLNPLMLIKATPLRVAINGHAAVMVFFVLSGFVLRSTFLGAQGPVYLPFVRQRLARLWLPCAFAILLGAVLYRLLGSSSVGSVQAFFTHDMWQAPITAPRIGAALAVSGRGGDLLMDPPLWSLDHEIRISLLFPLIALLVRRRPLAWLAGATVLHVVCLKASPSIYAPNLAASLLQSCAYLVFFVLGFVVADQWRRAEQAVARLGKVGQAMALIAALLTFALPMGLFVSDLCYGLAAAVLLALVAHADWVARPLKIAPIVWLGRVSFSLYLTHLIVFAGVLRLVYGPLGLNPSLGAMVVLLIPIALCVAEMTYRLVETPSKILSHRLAGPRPAAA